MALASYRAASFVASSGIAALAPLASIEVRKESDNTLASIFSDVNGSSALANPFQADAEGQFTFYVAGLARGYKVTATSGSSVRVLRNVAIGTGAEVDISDAIGAVLNNTTLAAFLTAIGLGSGSTPSFLQVLLGADPTVALQAATKQYVDAQTLGSDLKNSVLCATTANITLSGEQTLDGILTSASRVLVKNQTTPAQNGIYVSAAGAWTRALDMDSWLEVPGAFVMVERGTVAADTAWVSTADQGGTLNTTAITWVQFGTSGGISAPQVDVFTTPGANTWTKRAGATMVTGVMISGGGGGSSGRRGATATDRHGGSGGGGGDTCAFTIQASLLGATETVTVGAAGTGGAAVAADNTDGNPGTVGTSTSFGTWFKAVAADGAAQGGTSAQPGNPGGYTGLIGSNQTAGYNTQGGASDLAQAANNAFTSGGYAPGSGGGGGAVNSANVARNGGAGSAGSPGGLLRAAGTAGVVGGAAATGGTAQTANLAQGGGGGGGGAGSVAGAGGTGGAGAIYGGAGGGGGASVNGQLSGAGGAGASGIAVIIQT